MTASYFVSSQYHYQSHSSYPAEYLHTVKIYKFFDKGNLRILINPCVAVIAAGAGNMGYVK